LLDEHQVVRPGEIGTVEAIEAAASARGLRVHTISLKGQCRCGGSAAYEEWVLQLLGLDGGGPQPWKGDDRFEVLVADSPMEMEAILRQKHDEGFSARNGGGLLLAVERPARRRHAGARCPDRPGVASAVERQERASRWGSAWTVVLGHQSGRLRSGRLRLARPRGSSGTIARVQRRSRGHRYEAAQHISGASSTGKEGRRRDGFWP
jgi:hypothetical protein